MFGIKLQKVITKWFSSHKSNDSKYGALKDNLPLIKSVKNDPMIIYPYVWIKESSINWNVHLSMIWSVKDLSNQAITKDEHKLKYYRGREVGS